MKKPVAVGAMAVFVNHFRRPIAAELAVKDGQSIQEAVNAAAPGDVF